MLSLYRSNNNLNVIEKIFNTALGITNRTSIQKTNKETENPKQKCNILLQQQENTLFSNDVKHYQAR